MGVPSFFRWLIKKYPKVVTDVIEERPIDVNGTSLPVDLTQPNPNHFETDNLYLDMNGIIHPCCHPEDSEAPDDENEMIHRIFAYIDRIFAMVRPRQLLYMAIDGVAPRAKMNQQRSRRFRSAREMAEKEELEEKLRKEWTEQGRTLPPKKKKPWDSNVITPGTRFMHNLSIALHWYIADRLQHEPAWKGIKVIFSDAKVPGEGEHKIMKFMRNQRAQPSYNPNTSHTLYGMDADLIMLGLATHDPYFRIIRETVTEPARRCQLCGQEGHYMEACTGEAKKQEEVHEEVSALKPFQFLHINILREYLAHDLYVSELPFQWDLERAIDDFVFLCIAEGTPVAVPSIGLSLPIEDVPEGATVHALSSGGRGLVPRTVQRRLAKAARPCIELLFQDGRTLVCTPDHLIRTADGAWVRADALQVGTVDLEGTAVAVGMELPMFVDDIGQWEAQAGGLSFGGLQALRFARLVGYIMADGCVTSSGAKLFVGDELDAVDVASDIRLLIGEVPIIHRLHDAVTEVRLSAALAAAVSEVCRGWSSSRVDRLTVFPAMFCSSTCPVAVVREFLGGLFGGDGQALRLQKCDDGTHAFAGLALSWRKKGRLLSSDELAFSGLVSSTPLSLPSAQKLVFQQQLLPMLNRCGVLQSVAVVSPCSVGDHRTEKESEQTFSGNLKGESLSAVGDATLHSASKSFEIKVDIGVPAVLDFARSVGFRYCCQKQQTLTASAAYFRAVEYVQRQRDYLIRRTEELSRPVRVPHTCGCKAGLSIPTAIGMAKNELAEYETLHPDIAAFCPERADQLRSPLSSNTASGCMLPGCDESLDLFGVRQFFNEDRERLRYSYRRTYEYQLHVQAERSAEGCCAGGCGEEVDDGVEWCNERACRSAWKETLADALAFSQAIAAADRKQHYDSPQMSMFKVQLIGRRDAGVRRVWDLVVPNGTDEDIDSFTAGGVVVHNCFFVGNDFLPHLPSLEIREGAIERLVGIYKRLLPSMGGYIAENGILDMSRVDILLSDLGMVEDGILKARKHREEQWKAREKEKMEKIKRIKEERANALNKVIKFAEETGMRAVSGNILEKKEEVEQETKGTKRKFESIKEEGKEEEEKAEEEKEEEEEEEDEKAKAKRLKRERKARKRAKREREESQSAEGKDAQMKEEEAASIPVTIKVDSVDDNEKSKSKTSPIQPEDVSESESVTVSSSEQVEALISTMEESSSEEEDAVAPIPSPLKEAKHLTEKLLAIPETGDAQTDFAALLNARLKAIAEPAAVADDIRFGDEGWKDRYYTIKMKCNPEKEEDMPMLRKLFSSYAEGLSWVMQYYYRGCQSWSWYYPFHYAPMASDLRNLDRFRQQFELSAPFSPIGQLMGVLPAASAHCMPEGCRELMMNPRSPLADFYPEDFPLDLNGKKYLWQAVALLPWIDEQRLLKELKKVEPTFTAEEKERNSMGEDYLFVHTSHRMANTMTALHLKHMGKLKKLSQADREKLKKEIDPKESGGLTGFISPYHTAITPGSSLKSNVGLETLTRLPVVSCVLHGAEEREHQSVLLEGLIMPPPVLTEMDLRDDRRGGRGGGQPRLGEGAQFMANQEQWAQRTQGGGGGGAEAVGGGYSIRLLDGDRGYSSAAGHYAAYQQTAPPPAYGGHAYYDQFIRNQPHAPSPSPYAPLIPSGNPPGNRNASYPPYPPPAPPSQYPSPYPPHPSYPSYPYPYPYQSNGMPSPYPPAPYAPPPPPVPYTFSRGPTGSSPSPPPPPPQPYTFSKSGGRGPPAPPPPPMPYIYPAGARQGGQGYAGGQNRYAGLQDESRRDDARGNRGGGRR